MKLGDNAEIAAAAAKHGRKLFDVRHSAERFATGKGAKRPGKRLLTVGTDCSVGKKYTALALERAMRARGLNADFRATGQTGVFISGRGVSVDAVVADFIAGAAEWLTPANDPGHWDVVEGQGSLFHPSFAGVTLGLLHGAQPDAFVVCHEPTRTPHARRRAPPALDPRGHRPHGRLRPADQPRHPLHRHRHQHRAAAGGRGAARHRRRPSARRACRPPTR